MKIDTHQHYWQYVPIEYPWITADLSVLCRDYMPSDVKLAMQGGGYSMSIAVQARQSVGETEWLLNLARNEPMIAGVVGWVDLCSETVSEQLERYSNDSKFVGVRHILQDEPDDNFILKDEFQRGIGALEAYDLVYELIIRPKHLPYSYLLAKKFSEQPFVLDHIAKPFIKQKLFEPWAEEIIKLGSLPNVSCKLSGLITEADWKCWKQEDFVPFLDTALEAFGPSRLMIGSDWPVCLLAGSYSQAMSLVEGYISKLSKDEQRAILGENAMRIYGLEAPSPPQG